jgi:DNA-directed RNA polymerase specialized sigma24 family protein
MDFDNFYREEHCRLLGLCVLVTLDVEAAADATQEAMLRRGNAGHSADGQPEVWVHRRIKSVPV